MNIVVCFQQDRIHILQMFNDIIIVNSKISSHRDALAIRTHPITTWFRSIMRNGKWLYLHIPQCEWLICMDFTKKFRQDFAKTFAFFHCIQCAWCAINRHFIFPAEYPQSLNMVGMFMGNKDPINLLSFDLQVMKSFFYSLFTDACINQQMRVVCTCIDTVPTASASYTA